jgi:hypothetical protein
MEATDGAKALFKLRFITRQFLCLSLKITLFRIKPSSSEETFAQLYELSQLPSLCA